MVLSEQVSLRTVLFFYWMLGRQQARGLVCIHLQLPQEVEPCGRLHLLPVQVESQNKHGQDDGGYNF